MAIGVDSSKWKPRKLAGTPAIKTGNIIAASILTFGIISGAFYQFSGLMSKYRQSLERFYSDPIEEVERKQLIASGLSTKKTDEIRKELAEFARPDTPDK